MKSLSYRNLASRLLRASAVMAAASGLSAATASDLYRLTVIAVTPSSPGSGTWAISRSGLGIDTNGNVSWAARRTSETQETGIFVGDGVTQKLIAQGVGPGPGPGLFSSVGTLAMNNQGQVTFYGSINPGDAAQTQFRYLWDPVSESTVALRNCNPGICNNVTVSDDGRSAFTRGNPQEFSFQDSAGSLVFTRFVAANRISNVTGSGAISSNGRNAAWVGRLKPSNDAVVVTLDESLPDGLSLTVPVPGRSEFLDAPTANNLGTVAYLLDSVTEGYVGFSNARSNRLGIVADFTDGFTRFGASAMGGPAINDLNEVFFAGTSVADGGPTAFVGDVSGRTPYLVASLNEVIPDSNLIFTGVQQGGVYPRAINNKGQLAFYAWVREIGTSGTLMAVIRADPVQGVSPGTPILPGPEAAVPGEWRFLVPCSTFCGRTTGEVRQARRAFINPPVALGYEYAVEAPGPNVTAVYIAAPLPNGDGNFQLEFADQSIPLVAGEEVDITQYVPDGVATFRITGIDPSEVIDPYDPTAFVTGLTFADSESDGAFGVTMVAITDAPPAEPGDLDGDGDVDRDDLAIIMAALSTDADGPDDPRDLNHDGRITVRDALMLIRLCTRTRCAV